MNDELTPVWKALSDPSRRRILDLLRERPHTTGELCDAFDVSRYAVMKHLNVLVQAELVIVRRQGRVRWNHLNAVPIQRIYERWVSEYEGQWASSLLDLKQFTERKKGGEQSVADTLENRSRFNEVHIEQVVTINASLESVFDALTHEISLWWKAPFFHGDNETTCMELEPRLGGRLYEDWGEGEGLLLATVYALKRPQTLHLHGALGMTGPVSGEVLFQLEEQDGKTLLRLTHRAIGVINHKAQENYAAGWEKILGTLLRQHVENPMGKDL